MDKSTLIHLLSLLGILALVVINFLTGNDKPEPEVDAPAPKGFSDLHIEIQELMGRLGFHWDADIERFFCRIYESPNSWYYRHYSLPEAYSIYQQLNAPLIPELSYGED